MQLLTKSEVAAMLHVGRDSAVTILDSWGVPFINLGPGRGRGRRWDAADVEKAIEARKTLVGVVKPRKPGRRKKDDLWKRPTTEIIAIIRTEREAAAGGGGKRHPRS